MTFAALQIDLGVLGLGTITGLTYGILAVGLVLIFRSSQIINFAHGEIGAFGAAVLGVAVREWGVPYWVGLPGAVLLSAGIGALTEVVVVRRLRSAPNVMSIVATLGVAQFLLLLSFVVNNQAAAGSVYPQPPGFPSFRLGALRVTPAHTAMVVLVPAVVAALALFLKRSRFGLGIRAAAANVDAARLAGVSARRMSTLPWAIAGAVSAITAVLVIPTRGFVTGESLGPGLLLRALLAAVIARMTNLPVALGAGIVVGVVEQVLFTGYPDSGVVEVVLFAGVLGALLLQSSRSGRNDQKGSWAVVQASPPTPSAIARLGAVRAVPWVFGAVALAAAVVIPRMASNSAAISFIVIAAISLVGLSIGIVTGLAGQLSLGQFAVAGVGAATSYHVTLNTGNYFVGFAAAGACGAVASIVVGLPALRIRGLMLAVSTLSFALAAESWLLRQPWMLSGGVDPGRPLIGSVRFDTGRSYYYLCLALLVGSLLLARNIWRGGLGLRFRAVRDNEDAARAFTISPVRVKLEAFALSGVMAGLGGAVFGHTLSRLTAGDFRVSASINVVAITVVGGIGTLVGPLLGSLYIIGVPRFLPLDSAGLAATALGWLVLLLYFPGGIAQLVLPLRQRTVAFVARRFGGATAAGPADAADGTAAERVAAEPAGPAPARVRRPASKAEVIRELRFQDDQRRLPRTGPVLTVRDLRRSFGGIDAVAGVSLEVGQGEIVGLIGPNGAGKTTLFELISGFTKADAGQVVLDRRAVDALPAHERARRGLIRSFQDCALFPTLTVAETLRLSLERVHPTALVPSVVGLGGGSDRSKGVRAEELAELMGLGAFLDKQISELSTGTRRITELACVVALRPRLLLLDEPSSGVAQRETEQLGELLRTLRDQLKTSMLLVEHDIPLVMSISDRVIAMEAGRVIAEGSPEEVGRSPAVVASYLGTDRVAVERSSAGAAPRKARSARAR